MIKTLFTISILFIGLCNNAMSQSKTDANLFGDVQSEGEHVPFVNIYIEGTNIGTTTDHTGHYMLLNLPEGKQTIVAKTIGYKQKAIEIDVAIGKTIELNFELEEEHIAIGDIVVTGTKTFKRSTESAVIVNVLDAKTIKLIQANTLSESLCFQPGLRVETDCQTCNYSQLRMNGLGGSYSQILVNGRPVFSPLTGLYGLEQIPSNMIDRIEVVRGGGSALYGSSAIGGTVNIITSVPKTNGYEISVNHSLINGVANDNMINGSVNALSDNRNTGVSFFGSRRSREWYDHNDDNYSEMPTLKNNSFGFTAFFKPKYNQKLELSMSSLYEYRYGGEMINKAAHMAEQSEERTHNVLMASLDYQIDFNDHSTFIIYTAGQGTKRDHYTGVIPDTISYDDDNNPTVDYSAYNEHFLNPPYGDTDNKTYQVGTQYNYKAMDFIGGINTFTGGAEYVYDYIYDEVEAYQYLTNQTTKNTGVFLQSDWDIFSGFTLLSGVRADKHNFLDKVVFNPRFSALYKLKDYTQFRASWSTGFRAPQAFDSDLHMSFAGGGVSRIVLADDLKEERSNSYTLSVNYDKPSEHYIYGITLDGFYTNLMDAFVLEEAGEDDIGIIYEKRNASSSVVKGVTIEARGNYDKKVQLEAGYTIQSSQYGEAISYSENLEPTKDYLRTPTQYGYYTLTYTTDKRISASLSGVYTGKMNILHIAGATNGPTQDEYKTTIPYNELNAKIAYTFDLETIGSGVEFFLGMKNIFDNFQDDFDMGKDRDSNYIYGPASPRTVYFGVKLLSL